MPFLQPSIEEAPPPENDPWDWSVDQVIYALTNTNSPLLDSNRTLSLPDSGRLAIILRELDVNGLALLTLVKDKILRDEWGVKSMSYRASILHLARVLQDQSQKYEKHVVASGRVSSLGGSSRFSTPYVVSPQQHIPQAASRAIGLSKAPIDFGGVLQTTTGIDVVASIPNTAPLETANMLAEAPALQNGPLRDMQLSMNPQLDQDAAIPIVESDMEDRSDDRVSRTPSKRQGETIVVDATGKKRRKLVLAQPEGFGQAYVQKAAQVPPQGNPDLPTTSTKPLDAIESAQASSHSMLKPPLLGDREAVIDGHESPATSQDQEPRSTVQVSSPGPGTVRIDEQGRKRLRPISLSQPDLSTGTPSFGVPASGGDPRQRAYGRRMKRAPEQLYLGVDSLSVDKIFYDDIGLEKEVKHSGVIDNMVQQDPESDFENFKILSQDTYSNGQRLYVNSRMRHFLLSPRLILERNGIEHVGVIIYPERLGKKHYPLSITIFSKSRDGITVSRSNRSKWIRDHKAPSPTDPNTESFNMADPVLAQDDNKDYEWAALEKWKYLDGQDKILPLYGDSGSEGEYELDTWKEIEQERGTIERPSRKSKHQQLTNEEVNETINRAMEQLIQDWSFKRLPKLRERAWRFWAKSRRDGNADFQIRVLTFETEKLDGRINNLRKEIVGEVWSKTSQVEKQCKIIQPSLFDREDNEWRIALLRSNRVPAKPLLVPGKSKATRLPKPPKEVKQDEEDLDTDRESSESSNNSLDDFVVEDEIEVDNNEAVLGDDDLSMADLDDDAKFQDLPGHAGESPEHGIQGTKDDHLGPRRRDVPEPNNFLKRLTGEPILLEHDTPLLIDHQDRETSENRHDMSNFIDLTQQSDPAEPIDCPVKPEIDYAIRTPPLFDSENDSDVFRRSRGKKPPVFRKPISALESSNVIDLDTDSTESEAEVASRVLPAYTDVNTIRAMVPFELVRRQDRKRLLIWMIAHTPTLRREASFDYLRHSSFDQTYQDVAITLRGLRGHKKFIVRGKDPELLESVVQIAVWRVCWTVPIKVDRSGLMMGHVVATLADQDGYRPFYDFLLECMNYYTEPQDFSDEILPTEKREKIVEEESEVSEDSNIHPMRKRKFAVQESQATLDKRKAARDRLQADDERRHQEECRREELKYRFAGVQKEDVDSLGVILNPGKLEDQDFVYLNPRFGNGVRLRPHQKEGLQFLWREITADHDDLQGCLLAQTMGLGKTMQIIALMVALSEASHSQNRNICQQVPPTLHESRTLVLCPPALVENWWDEFILWVPQPSSENIGEVRKVTSTLLMTERLDQIYTWSKEGGVLLISYDAFKGLVKNNPRLAAKAGAKKAPLDESEHSRVKEALIGSANLVIADEAHYFKSTNTAINAAMNQIRTTSRIALTGSPLNNNLEEYYTLIDWIAPNYLGTRVEFKATYEEPIREGNYRDSTDSQKRTSMKKLKALELEMEPKVHRASASVLPNDLKGKSDFVVVVALTKLQEKAYNIYVRNMRLASRENEPHLATLWTWLGVLQLLCNHPQCYWKKLHEPRVDKKKKKSAQPEQGILASEEDATLLNEATSQVALGQVIEESKDIFENLTQPLEALCLSNKMQVLMQILGFADAARDKVLVFSHRIATLDYIVDQLAKASKTYARIDGTLDTNKRQQISKDFNTGNVNICLISTRAGGTGLNFYGANRVVIMDQGFNPACEQQAIGRAYRIGQQKPVYVYRLQTAGTFEGIIQNQGLFKEQLATRVVDKKNPTRSATKGTGAYLFPPNPVQQEDLTGSLGKDPLVLDRLLTDQNNHILSIMPSEIFHIEDNENLTPEERVEAEQMQKDEQLRRRDPATYFAMLEGRRHASIHKVQQATRVPTTPRSQQASFVSTQPVGRHKKVAGPDSPLQLSPVASASHLSTKATASCSIAPSRSTHAGNMPPPTAASDSYATPTSIVERAISTPASTLHTNYTSDVATPPDAHIRSSSAGPSNWTAIHSPLAPECLDKELLDRQLLVPNPSPTVPGDGDTEILDALNKAIGNLFRHTNAASNQSPNERRVMSESIQDTAKEDFYAAMSAKGLRNPMLALADAARKLYAQELSHIIFEMSSEEAEYRSLVAGVKQLLERDEVKPKHLVKVMMEKHNPVTGPSAMKALVDVPRGIQMTKTDAEKVQANGKAKKGQAWDRAYRVNAILSASIIISEDLSEDLSEFFGPAVPRESCTKGDLTLGRQSIGKRAVIIRGRQMARPWSQQGLQNFVQRQRQDDGHQPKKAKGAPAIGPNFKSPSGHTEQQFQDLLQKEANRASV